ncbi:hypothetical protein K438DRAFT_1767529 [Mycena galopus ATCC 62051]|nr:hypothetical protein K438DRAFT_1767529 [Mycena galopus ATCC 62051]
MSAFLVYFWLGQAQLQGRGNILLPGLPCHDYNGIIVLRGNRSISGKLAGEITYISPANSPGYLCPIGGDASIADEKDPGGLRGMTLANKRIVYAHTRDAPVAPEDGVSAHQCSVRPKGKGLIC